MPAAVAGPAKNDVSLDALGEEGRPPAGVRVGSPASPATAALGPGAPSGLETSQVALAIAA